MARHSKLSNFTLTISCIFLLFTLSRSECNIPSEFWCENTDIAKQCGVFEQCQQFLETNANAPLVDFTLYYESLCPDCKNFFNYQLAPGFSKLRSIMNLTLVPYGNALEKKVGDKWVFQCQHGEQECIGNIIETCAINIIQNISVYFPFISCMEKSQALPTDAAKECAKIMSVPLDSIMACTKSSQGNQWEHEMAVKTENLKPAHKYVPWVTVNGVHTEKINNEATQNLIKLICDTYTGPKPSFCSQSNTEQSKHYSPSFVAV